MNRGFVVDIKGDEEEKFAIKINSNHGWKMTLHVSKNNIYFKKMEIYGCKCCTI
jgi:hypothetical protein